MRDIDRLLLAEQDYWESDLWLQSDHDLRDANLFNQWLAQWGCFYDLAEPPEHCVKIIDPQLYTMFVIKYS